MKTIFLCFLIPFLNGPIIKTIKITKSEEKTEIDLILIFHDTKSPIHDEAANTLEMLKIIHGFHAVSAFASNQDSDRINH